MANYGDSSTYSTASGKDGLQYVVLQVTLKEKGVSSAHDYDGFGAERRIFRRRSNSGDDGI